MNHDIEITQLDLVAGGNVIRQGHHFTLDFTPRGENGDVIALTGKDIYAVFYDKNGIRYEGAASYVSSDAVIRVSITENIGHGTMWIEFTATDPVDATYKKKFPARENNARISITPSTDDLSFVGVKSITVEQLRNEQMVAQQEFEAEVLPRVETVEGKQAQLAADYQAAAGALTEDSEVILARGDEPTLGARLNKTTAQLAETAKESHIEGIVEGKTFDKGIITFTFDDGNSSPYDNAFPLFQAKGMPMCLALQMHSWNDPSITNRITLEEALNVQANGGEILSHTVTGRVLNSSVPRDAIEWELEESRNVLTSYGFHVRNFVATGSDFNPANLDLLKKHYDGGFLFSKSTGFEMTHPINPYGLTRVNMEGKTLSELQTIVDSVATNKSVVVFYEHNIGTGSPATTTATLSALLDYIATKQVDVLTASEMINKTTTRLIGKESPERQARVLDAQIMKEPQKNLLTNPELSGFGSAVGWTWNNGSLSGTVGNSISTTFPANTLIITQNGNTGAGEEGEYYQDYFIPNSSYVQPFCFSFEAQSTAGSADTEIIAKITSYNGDVELSTKEEVYTVYAYYRKYFVAKLVQGSSITRVRVSVKVRNNKINNGTNFYIRQPKLENAMKPSIWSLGIPVKDSFNVTKSGVQSFVPNAWTRVNFEVINFSEQGNFVSNRFVVKKVGRHRISAGVTFNASEVGKTYKMALYNNATPVHIVSAQSSVAGSQVSLTLSTLQDFAGNTPLFIFVWHDATVAQTVQADAGTWFTGETV